MNRGGEIEIETCPDRDDYGTIQTLLNVLIVLLCYTWISMFLLRSYPLAWIQFCDLDAQPHFRLFLSLQLEQPLVPIRDHHGYRKPAGKSTGLGGVGVRVGGPLPQQNPYP